jgi:hypothetical protein
MLPALVSKSATKSVRRHYSLRLFSLLFFSFLLLACTPCDIHIYISTYINVHENRGPLISMFPHP